MLFRVGLAVLVAIVLVGGAVWVRTSDGKRSFSSLIGVERGGSSSHATDSAALWPDLTAYGTSDLSKTDIISRQLISDYMGLAVQDKATEGNLNQLLENYMDSVPELGMAPKIDPDILKKVADNPANFAAYDKATTEIDQVRTAAIKKAYDTGGTSDEAASSLAGAIASAYQTAADKMTAIAIPEALIVAHWKLVNNYLSTAYALNSISRIDSDSMAAFAGMITVNQSLAAESQIVSEIVAILTKNGI